MDGPVNEAWGRKETPTHGPPTHNKKTDTQTRARKRGKHTYVHGVDVVGEDVVRRFEGPLVPGCHLLEWMGVGVGGWSV